MTTMHDLLQHSLIMQQHRYLKLQSTQAMTTPTSSILSDFIFVVAFAALLLVSTALLLQNSQNAIL